MTDEDFTLLQGYLDELHHGGASARDALLARRPDLADLLECLDGLDRLAAPPEDDAPTLPVLAAPPPEPPSTVTLPQPIGHSASTRLKANWVAGAWAWSTVRGRSTSIGRSRSR